ncbi:hypothetical protein ACFYRN_45205 [Streptomyces sp. NPDC005227]|uniref:hypothetical protein n=1 Tax=Streptomyces sp. NPDC005227 TaxID=3364707 RepID=UPI0036767F01
MTAQPDLTALEPLARVIAEKVHNVPVRHCPGGTDDLISELTLAVAIYTSRHVLPPGLPAAVVRPDPMTDEQAAVLLAPLEAKARALRAEKDAEHRATVLREAADIAESLRQFEHATGARWSAQVSENVGILRVADELRRLADAASGPGQPVDEPQEDTAAARDWGDLEDMAARERPLARDIVTALSRKAAAASGQWPPADETQPSNEPALGFTGKGRAWCLTCPRPDDENAPLTLQLLAPYEECAGCHREIVEVARAQQPDSGATS